ncbi:MAG: hypothetical protein H0T46_06305 [Deltaproteobacteria bacterium]|nr:hypothetical protein [Deltaproteobacteria bacterium]
MATLVACGGSNSTPNDSGPDALQVTEGACQITATAPDSLTTITCKADFDSLAALPFDSALPGATSIKVVLDRLDGDAFYFQNTKKFDIHYEFVSKNLSGNGKPIVADLATFNTTEYFTPDRRFVLGAVTYYSGPKRWALELSPYDTASVELISALFEKAKHASYFGPELAFHPTSSAIATVAGMLPAHVPVVTTDELYAGIDYQPLSLGEAVGRLHFTTAASLAAGEYLSYQNIVVLDSAPNDISVVQGIITQDFQTPLSHVNVLSHARGTTNMGLRKALTNSLLLQYKNQLVKIVVGAAGWTITPVTQAEAEAFWAANAPPPVTLPTADLSVTTFTDLGAVTPEPATPTGLLANLRAAIRAYGGKAAHYSVLLRTPGVPIKDGFAIPIYFYDQFMTQHGFYARVDAMLANPTFTTDPATRDAALAQFRADMIAAPLDAGFQAALGAKATQFSTVGKLRFRSSSNSEDLDGFPCAGCYESHSGKVDDINDLMTAIKEVYADAWSFRTFEIRTFYGVDHKTVGMGLLVHPNFPDEEANGVAVTANPFVASALDPAFYINVQKGGDIEVVAPPPGITSDQFVYYFDQPNQPTAYITHSNLVPAGQTVLNPAQIYALGMALSAIRTRFSPAYGPAAGNNGWYALEVDFKFDDEGSPGQPPTCYIKQARPYKDPRTTP